MRAHTIIGAIFTAIFFQNAMADTVTSGEEIIVTATRTTQTADETLASVSVIGRKDIENSQATTVTDLFRLEAGIDIARTGGPGQQTSLFLRGGNSDHALVLIDGIRVSSGTTGSFPWEKLSLEQIERIEIVRGPRSVQYGSEAIGGVIQIFTRRSNVTTGRIEAGSFGTHGASAASSFGEKLKIYLSADYRAAEGFSATNPNFGAAYDSDNDGYASRSISLAARSKLSKNSEFDFSLWSARSNDDFDGGNHESLNQAARIGLTTTQNGRWSHTIMLSNILDDLTTVSSFPSRIITRRDAAEWLHNISFKKNNSLTVGLGHNIENASNDTAPFNNQVASSGVFTNWQHAAGANDLELGLRSDIHSAFGQHNTWQLAWGRRLASKWRLYTSYGTAFKAPDQNELYHPGFGGFFAGNPALQPETSASIEIGLRFRKNKFTSAKTSIYVTDIANLIAYQGTNSQAINISRSRLQGIEAEISSRFGKWDSRSSFTLQSARNASTSVDLLRRPAVKLSLKLNRHLNSRSNIGVEFLAVSNHADFDNISYSTIDVPAYAIVNLGMRRSLGSDWALEGRADNLLDKKYEIVSGYNAVPRSIQIRLRYAPAN